MLYSKLFQCRARPSARVSGPRSQPLPEKQKMQRTALIAQLWLLTNPASHFGSKCRETSQRCQRLERPDVRQLRLRLVRGKLRSIYAQQPLLFHRRRTRAALRWAQAGHHKEALRTRSTHSSKCLLAAFRRASRPKQWQKSPASNHSKIHRSQQRDSMRHNYHFIVF